MDLAAFVLAAAVAGAMTWHQSNTQKNKKKRARGLGDGLSDGLGDDLRDDGIDGDDNLFYVNADNEPLSSPLASSSNQDDDDDDHHWHRATYLLVMHDPPDMFYEPKEWSHTAVLLLRRPATENNSNNNSNDTLVLPGGTLYKEESFEHAAVRHLMTQTAIDVHAPCNCLHHVFTFPYDSSKNDSTRDNDITMSNNNKTEKIDEVKTTNNNDNKQGETVANTTSNTNPDNKKQWADFMEVVYRGTLEELDGGRPDLQNRLVRISLEQLKTVLKESPQDFDPITRHAILLYFQRQMELRAKRRLLKGYSSVDLERYGLRRQESSGIGSASGHASTSAAGGGGSGSAPPQKIVLKADQDDSERGQAVHYTMQTDDGMSPKLLLKADVVLLGVSRAGKTPLSLLLSQTAALKVANIPLVVELPPPRQLMMVDARRVFLITQSAEHLVHVRQNRLRRELRGKRGGHNGQRSTYADPDYVKRDLEEAKVLALDRGYTIIDLTDRAMEEAASIISSKIKERFPETDMGDNAIG